MNRRQALKLFGGGVAALGTGKAVDNVLIGYGVLLGTNLREQSLRTVAGEHLPTNREYRERLGEYELLRQEDLLFLLDDESVVEGASIPNMTPERASQIDEHLAVDEEPFTELYTDIPDLEAGRYEFEFHNFEEFFDRVSEGEPRPFTTGLLRSSRTANPDIVAQFSGADPADPSAVLRGLIDGFRAHSFYDVPRYVAGSITDNVLMRTVRLRKYFESSVDFQSLMDADGTGMFCYEFTHRSMEAVHALPAYEQTAPVVGVRVNDYRHKHVYTGIASVVRADGEL